MSRPNPIARTLNLLSEFFRLQSAGGIMLMLAAGLAMILANSPANHVYEAFLHMPVSIRVGAFGMDEPAEFWINDLLMAVFFLLVALEIKREALSGQLSSRDQMMLPMLCALGGVVVPAALYWVINHGETIAMRGWAIPTATDIAFALGILALLGPRVPFGMKLLLSTIAVVDDLVAILIIAVFYTHELAIGMLIWAGAGVGLMLLLNWRGVKRLWPYLLLGAVVWYFVLKSGVHATLAGVVTGLLIPLKGRDEKAPSPLESLEHTLHPWVAYLILPLFAFTNAGLSLSDLSMSDVVAPVPLGIGLGLVFGKPIGIVTTAMITTAIGLTRYPAGMDFKAMLGLGMLCGVGFTMSLFITNLAFANVGNHLVEAAVLGVLCGSLLSAVLGWLWLRVTLKPLPV